MRSRVVLPAAALALLGAACGDDRSTLDPCDNRPVVQVRPSQPRILRVAGDTLRLTALVRDECGDRRPAADATWSSSDTGVARVEGEGDEALVTGVATGAAEIAATVDTLRDAARVTVEITPPASVLTLLGVGLVENAPRTTDLSVHGAIAVTGTGPAGGCDGPDASCDPLPMNVWDISAPGSPTLLAAVPTGSPSVPSVTVGPDGDLAAAAVVDGIRIYDIADPRNPVLLTHHTDGLEGGALDVSIERIAGTRWIFVAEDGGSATGGLHVLDADAPGAPVEVARFHAGHSFVAGVSVREGLAFVSHWDAGLVIVDVGAGTAGGSPENPVEVSRIRTQGGQVRDAWHWPEGGWVFVAEEDHLDAGEPPDSVGRIHVVDLRDPFDPEEVASFGMQSQSPGELWLDEEIGVLLAAWNALGVRAIDVTGRLSGRLEDENREIGAIIPPGLRGGIGIATPRLRNGVVFAAGRFHGLWALGYDAEAARMRQERR